MGRHEGFSLTILNPSESQNGRSTRVVRLVHRPFRPADTDIASKGRHNFVDAASCSRRLPHPRELIPIPAALRVLCKREVAS